MKTLVTGSAGHLGEALVRTLKELGHEVCGVDILPSTFTDEVFSIVDRPRLRALMQGVEVVFHTATLHKPHVATHSKQDFVDTNITGTLNLLEESVSTGVKAFIFTSTTSVFGDGMVPKAGGPAVWVTENTIPIPKNIYGVTKAAAEDLCQLFYRNHGLPTIVLRTSRFFPEDDDNKATRDTYAGANAKVNEYLYRRVDIEDVVSAHLLAAERAEKIGFDRYIISATTPFTPDDLNDLNQNAHSVVCKLIPKYENTYTHLNWKMFPTIDRVYVNEKARKELGWEPRYDFAHMLALLQVGDQPLSPLAQLIGSKGYHEEDFSEEPYPVNMTAATTRKTSPSDRARILDVLRKNPGMNAWAIQDLMAWPDQTSLYYVVETLERGEFTYLLLTGHPGARNSKTIVLSGDADKSNSLLTYLPASPWLVRETPATMLKFLKPNFPEAKIYMEDRMQVDRSSFRPVKVAATVKRLTPEDAPALAALKGAPPHAASGFIQWIKGAQLYGAWEGNRLVAIASTFVMVPDVWELIGIETSPEFRGRGYGTQVTSVLTEIALGQAPIVTLTVLKGNEPAQRLYKKLGYRQCEDRIWFDNGVGSAP